MIAVRSAHLMPEVMDCQNRASTLIYTSRPILCSQVDRDQGCMPVIGNEHTVVAIGLPIDLELKGCFQSCEAE